MTVHSINWPSFAVFNADKNIQNQFEELCRQLFIHEFVSQNKTHIYLHNNHNNPGLESEPILYEKEEIYIGYQAKYFPGSIDYSQIEDSLKKAITYYQGKLDRIYLYSNKAINTSAKPYERIENELNDAGIQLILVTGDNLLDSIKKYRGLGIYFGAHNIDHNWLVKQAENAAGALGLRYNKDFNVNTKTAEQLSVFSQDHNALVYFNTKKQNLLDEIKKLKLNGNFFKYYNELNNLEEFVKTLPDVDYNTICKVLDWQSDLEKSLQSDITQVQEVLSNKEIELENDIDDKEKHLLNQELNNVKLLQSMYYKLEISDVDKELLSRKFLVIKGKAGIGKTQLFAHEAFSILNNNDNALLILGGDFYSNHNIIKQLEENLSIKMEFEELLEVLEEMGRVSNRVVPIFIDALNESLNQELWSRVLTKIWSMIKDKDYVRLAISFRSEFENSILPDGFCQKDGVYEIEHQGFKGNSIKSLQKFFSHYGLILTPTDLLMSNIDNPLFLTLYCMTYRGDGVYDLPTLYNLYLEKANSKIYSRYKAMFDNAGYDSSSNLVSEVVAAISNEIIKSGKKQFTIEELKNLPVWEELGINSRIYINSLLEENILIMDFTDEKKYLKFTFDQMNDMYPAREIIRDFNNDDKLKEYLINDVLNIQNGIVTNWYNIDLFVSVCALYAEANNKECIDLLNSITDKDEAREIFTNYVRSFEWRNKIYLSVEEFLKKCKDYGISGDEVCHMFIACSLKVNHSFNVDIFHKILMDFPLNKRDYNWTEYINDLYPDDRMIQIIDLYRRGEKLDIENKEQITMLLILFSWFLTSSNRQLRDTTSKAMIEILKDNFAYCRYLLKKFLDVNDPYVIQRLFGIVFGACVRRSEENENEYRVLIEFIYENIFDKDEVYPDILLRDYAALTIQNFNLEYPDKKILIDMKKVLPPYKSKPIEKIETIDYTQKEYEEGEELISQSMKFEGMGMYGDFGRYIFQGALRNYEVVKEDIYNYAMHYIFNELGYSNNFFGNYDQNLTSWTYKYNHPKTERIGKKYQWITMFNILARLSDQHEIGTENSNIDCVRDFDPTINVNIEFYGNIPFFENGFKHIEEAKKEITELSKCPEFDKEKWVTSDSLFLKIQKADTILIDQDEEEWVVLSKYADTGRTKTELNNLFIYNWLFGYFVDDNQLEALKKNSQTIHNLNRSDLFVIPEPCTIYSGEYPWSYICKPALEFQFVDFRVPTDKEIQTTKHRINIKEDSDKIINTTMDILWNSQYDGSIEDAVSYSHPCAELIKSLRLNQKSCCYYDENRILTAFDTALINQEFGLVIRKSALDEFLKKRKLHLIWFVDALKEVRNYGGSPANYKDWSGLLIYDGESVKGEYYINK